MSVFLMQVDTVGATVVLRDSASYGRMQW